MQSQLPNSALPAASVIQYFTPYVGHHTQTTHVLAISNNHIHIHDSLWCLIFVVCAWIVVFIFLLYCHLVCMLTWLLFSSCHFTAVVCAVACRKCFAALYCMVLGFPEQQVARDVGMALCFQKHTCTLDTYTSRKAQKQWGVHGAALGTLWKRLHWLVFWKKFRTHFRIPT